MRKIWVSNQELQGLGFRVSGGGALVLARGVEDVRLVLNALVPDQLLEPAVSGGLFSLPSSYLPPRDATQGG